MKNKFLQLKEEIQKQVNKLDLYVNDYKEISRNIEIPSVAYLNWGVKLAESGRLDDAVEKFKTAALMPFNNPGVYINLGVAQIKQKNFEEAIKNFRTAVKLDKFNSKAYSMWASALSEIGDLKAAVEIYKLAQKYDPRDPDIYVNWGISLTRANLHAEAEEKFKKAISINPINPAVPFLWGIILIEQQRYEDAIHKFNHALVYSENLYEPFYYLAFCYLKLFNYRFAKTFAEKAIEADATKVDPYIILAECFMCSGKDEDCLKTFEAADATAQTNHTFYANWGIALQKYNHIDEAREKLYTALMMTPDSELVFFNLGVNFLMSKEFIQAEEFFKKVIEQNPKHSQSYFNLGTLHYNKGDYDSAVYYYKEAFSSDKKNYAIYFNIGNCYYKKNNSEDAIYYLKKCIEYCPKHVGAHLVYANLMSDKGDFQEALRKGRTAYLMDKNSPYTNFSFALILLRAGDYGDAKDKFENGFKLCSTLDSASQSVVNYACEYCNKILAEYNNDKVFEIRSILTEKITY